MGERDTQQFETITPAQLDLSAAPQNGQPEQSSSWLRAHINTILSGAALLVGLFVVVYLLPSKIEKPVVETPKENSPPVVSTPKGTQESPWAEAQASRERKHAQKILLDILSLQEDLEKKNVKLWEAEGYESARAIAVEGDELYRKRKFDEAKTKYNLTLELMQGLVTKAEAVFNEEMTKGNEALLAEDAKDALKSFELALAIDATDEDAISGQKRAANLEQVLQLSKRATNLLHAGELDEALAVAKEVISLDDQYAPIKNKLSEIQEAITDRNYGKKMSEGYAALNNKQFDKAKKAFKAAQTIKPQENDASTALKQVANQATQHITKSLMQEARDHEAAEQWEQAVASYDNALKQDKTLVQATVGQLKAKARYKLDQDLNTFIESPLRLSDSSVYRDALKTLKDAKALSNPGERLKQQISTLSVALKQAQTPIDVSIKSDNSTDVTLLRVGHLGIFETHQISLKPGKYVAVGKRPEYRDVRQEFTISLDDKAPQIVVQCSEKIIKTP